MPDDTTMKNPAPDPDNAPGPLWPALQLSPAPRSWRVGPECRDVFFYGEDFNGLTLTIELLSPDEAAAVTALLLTLRPDWRPSDDTTLPFEETGNG